MTRRGVSMRLLALFALAAFTGSAIAQHGASASNMTLLGHDELQGRSAYPPIIHRQGGRWIAYVRHHGGKTMNALTGRAADKGTSSVEVTDPPAPRFLAHIPAEPGQAESGGAQLVRACN